MSSRTILLARHGNTFDSSESAVWIGSRQDLPLVAAGREQARSVAHYLGQRHQVPARVLCGPLKRTYEFAQIVCDELSIHQAPSIDHRLDEIDLGSWGGKTAEEIAALYGMDILVRWDRHGVWPDRAGWVTQYPEFVAQVHDLVREVIWSPQFAGDAPILLVTSNGRLRFFLSLVKLAFETFAISGAVKVRTGAIGEMSWNGTEFKVEYWNRSAKDI